MLLEFTVKYFANPTNLSSCVLWIFMLLEKKNNLGLFLPFECILSEYDFKVCLPSAVHASLSLIAYHYHYLNVGVPQA